VVLEITANDGTVQIYLPTVLRNYSP
jgi:hypothetical protein